MTPRQYDALSDAHKRSVRHRDMMLAQVAAATINFSMIRPEKHVTVEDLMPGYTPPKQRASSKRMQAALAAERLRMTTIAHNAAVAAGRA